MTRWTRGPLIVVVGAAALAAGAWWGLVRDGAPQETGERRLGAVASGEVIDLVPGCTIDTCRVLARRDGFRFDGDDATMIAVAGPGCDGRPPSMGLHLVTPQRVLWSEQVEALCIDPVGGILRDATGHAFLVLTVGAHTQAVIALAVAGGEVEDFDSVAGRFDGNAGASARDLDGDGVAEIITATTDCEPDCARGHVEETVYRWNGREYGRENAEQ